MSGFDQHNQIHQDWLMKFLRVAGVTGFYEVQDVADLLQGRGRDEVKSTLAEYRAMRAALPTQIFLNWLSSQRAARGINVEPWWQEAEDRARLMELPGR
jgi:hypothetical protein